MSGGFRMKWWGRKESPGLNKIELISWIDNRPSPNPKTVEDMKRWEGDQFVPYWKACISGSTIAELTSLIDEYFEENSVKSPICCDGLRWIFAPSWSNHIYLDPGTGSDYYQSECEFAGAGLEEYSPGDPAGNWSVTFLHEMNEVDSNRELNEHAKNLARSDDISQ